MTFLPPVADSFTSLTFKLSQKDPRSQKQKQKNKINRWKDCTWGRIIDEAAGTWKWVIWRAGSLSRLWESHSAEEPHKFCLKKSVIIHHSTPLQTNSSVQPPKREQGSYPPQPSPEMERKSLMASGGRAPRIQEGVWEPHHSPPPRLPTERQTGGTWCPEAKQRQSSVTKHPHVPLRSPACPQLEEVVLSCSQQAEQSDVSPSGRNMNI